MATLLEMPFSPWSEKARWALDHHQFAYDKRAYVPLLGELGLRAKLGKWSGKVSVPVLFDGERAIMDSYEIAKYADARSGGSPLVPADREREVQGWNERCEVVMTVGRARSLDRALKSPRALDDMAPRGFPDLGGVSRALTSVGVRFVRRKYAVGELEAESRRVREVLDEMRTVLARGERYLLGSFSFADVAACAALQCVAPARDAYFEIGPGTRESFTDPDLAAAYGDLLEFRDRLYAEHRRPSA
jgi:glutathione S-transferase